MATTIPTLSSQSNGTLSSPGLGSGLNVSSIVSQLMAIEQQPLNNLNTKQASYQAELSTFGSVQGALSGFQSSLASLNNLATFQSLSASPSDSSILNASATSAATPGTYSISVGKLAQTQNLVAAGQASSATAIGSGAATTLTFDFGTISGGTLGTDGKYTGSGFTSNGNGSKTLTIDSSNNSLQGIRDAINAANIGVTASIINDGSGSPYRLTLTSTSSGSANSMKISVAGDAALSTLLTQDPAGTQNFSETQAAQNTEMTVNGIAVSKAGTSISDVIQGVTLNMQNVTTAPISLTVARNTNSISTAVSAFVNAFNSMHATLANLTAYDATTKTAGPLQGNSTVRMLQSTITNAMNATVNTSGALTNLTQIGVTFQKDGSLALDTAVLNTAITNNPNDIAGLFATVGKVSDSLITYSTSSSITTIQPGNYAVNVTQNATQGNLVGSAPAGTTTITTGSNDALDISVDGIGASITLAAGAYTAAQLAAEVQSKINGAGALQSAGKSVSVSQNGGVFTISSASYGSASAVGISGSGASNLMGGTPTATAGLDVTGTIGGVAATGSGQYLTAGPGNALGLKIMINGGALGERGTVSYSHGYAYSLDQLSTSLLASNGLLSAAQNGINSSIADIQDQIVREQNRLTAVQANYQKQFTALDTLISSMNSTSTYLTQQLANLSKTA